jgi:putative ABC transport system permease protein
MFRNYFKTAWRSLSANKIYSSITIAGLGVGIAVCLVIFVFIQYEQSYDAYHKNKARIYRVLTKGEKAEDQALASVPFPLPTAIENDFPDWKTTGIWTYWNTQVMAMAKDGQSGNKFKEKDGFFMVQPSFFSMFDATWLAGDPVRSLEGKTSVVLSKSTAEKYFGDWKEAMGRTIKIENRNLFTVTGILADPPANTDLKLNLVFNYNNTGFSQVKDWWTINSDHECYVLLPPNETVANADLRLRALSKKYRTPDNHSFQLLEPLSEVHFDAVAGNYSGRTITPDRIRTLWLIAGFILLIACVNFINISTAQAVNRSREVGVRKVLGGRRGQITVQFIMEAFLLVMASVLLAVGLTAALLSPVSRMLEMPLAFGVFGEGSVLLFLFATLVGVTLLAGFYPALVLSSFNPIAALKTKLAARSTAGINLRRGLVVLQFVIAQALIIGTLLMIRQMNYFSHADMGFNKAAIMTALFPGDSVSRTRLDYLENRLKQIRGVEEVSLNNSDPASDGNWWTGFNFDHAKKDIPFAAINKWADANYISTYGLQLVAGRNITTTDSIREFLVNETLVRKLGFSNPRDVLNRQINLWNGYAVGPVVGVIRDFHPSSLKDSLSAVFITNVKQQFNTASIKLEGNEMQGAIRAIQKVWSDVYPNYVFEYQFVDEKIANFYKEEANLSRFYKIFTSIAIFLSCLGLYGLASFMAAQRLKEVGIRKVLGATAANIVYLFSKEFVVLIGIAFVAAAPIAWYFVHKWIEQYVYRVSISGWVFALGGLLALVIALATVSFQAWRAAAANPVKNLRSE